MSEEPALEGLQELLPRERPDASVEALVLEHAHVVFERSVRGLERVVELVALEHVVVAAGHVAGTVLGAHDAADRPQRPRTALDPEDDALLRAVIADPLQDALR